MAVLTGIIDTKGDALDDLSLGLPVDSILAVQNNGRGNSDGPGIMIIRVGNDEFRIQPNNTLVFFVPKGVTVRRDTLSGPSPALTGSFQLVVLG